VNELPQLAICTLAISGSFWQSGSLGTVVPGNPRVAQEQFADWSHRNDALGRMFEYNLIRFPPTLQNRVGSISANSAGSEEACERGEETRIINQ
jgi:hypothetical protein